MRGDFWAVKYLLLCCFWRPLSLG
uniref:Uncharacterized protein n=1 Tax=Arundo donax TaxID=35708 RepID=A0A0A9F8L5_ARUDO